MIDEAHSFAYVGDEPDFRGRLAAGYDTSEGSRILAERAEARGHERAWQRFRLRLIVVAGAAAAVLLIGVTHA